MKIKTIDEKLKLIDCMIIGAQKSATSSLAYYLSQHPDICKHQQNEIPYFVINTEFQRGYSWAYNKYFSHYESLTAYEIIFK